MNHFGHKRSSCIKFHLCYCTWILFQTFIHLYWRFQHLCICIGSSYFTYNIVAFQIDRMKTLREKEDHRLWNGNRIQEPPGYVAAWQRVFTAKMEGDERRVPPRPQHREGGRRPETTAGGGHPISARGGQDSVHSWRLSTVYKAETGTQGSFRH